MLGLAIGVCSAALAQALSPRDRLIDLATIEITSELCKVELSEAQSEAISTIRNGMLDDGLVTVTDITDIHDQMLATMSRQVAEGLCRSDGPGLRFFNQKLTALGAP